MKLEGSVEKRLRRELDIKIDEYLGGKESEEIKSSFGLDYKTVFSKDEAKEIIKCSKDIMYFARYAKIVNPSKGIIPFELYDFQEDFIKEFIDNHFTVTLKSRQAGISTTTALLCLWLILFNNSYRVGVMSISGKEATEFLNKVKTIYSNLPIFLRRRVEEWNKQSLRLSNGSGILASTSTSRALRSFSMNLLVMDEAAFIPYSNDVYASIYPALSKAFESLKSRPYGIIIISTPNGSTGLFHSLFVGAEAGLNIYKPLKYHWSQVPDYDQAWYEDQKRGLNHDERLINQELELQFLGSGGEFLPASVLEILEVVKPVKIVQVENSIGEIWYWEPLYSNIQYALACDPATKIGTENSSVELVELSTGRQVAEYNGRCDNVVLTNIIFKLCVEANRCIAIIERNKGSAIIDMLERKYSNIFYDKVQVKRGKVFKEEKRPGLYITVKNRAMIESALYNQFMVYEPIKYAVIKSSRLINEAKTLIYNSVNKVEHASGETDDNIWAYAYAQYYRMRIGKFAVQNAQNIVSNVRLFDQMGGILEDKSSIGVADQVAMSEDMYNKLEQKQKGMEKDSFLKLLDVI